MRGIITGFMLLFMVGSILSSIVDGAGGMVVTRLTAPISANSTQAAVSNTEGLLESSWVQIGNERVKYSGTTPTSLDNLSRGYDSTSASAHVMGDKVYSPDAGAVNAALGFNMATTGTSVGDIGVMTVIMSFFTTTLPRIATWDYSFLREGNLQYLRKILAAFTTGFIIYMAYQIAAALGGILQSIFVR